MRHGKTINHLGRTKSHRDALLSNMTCSLIKSKRITTTLAKAKALRKFAEPLITKSKNDSTHSRRTVFSYLQDKEAIKELFDVISEKVAERNGGYTRILKLGTRLGDNAEMAVIELVDFNDNYSNISEEDNTEKKAKRSRRGGKAKVAESATGSDSSTETEEVVADEIGEASNEDSAESSTEEEEKA